MTTDFPELRSQSSERLLQCHELFAVFLEEIAAILKRKTTFTLGKQGEEKHRALAQASQRAQDLRRQHVIALQRRLYIAAQLFHSSIADGNAKVTASHIFQFVRLVEDDRAHLWQNACIGSVFGLLFDGKIGEKQMMIDDDDVTLHCPPVHFRDEAFIKRTLHFWPMQASELASILCQSGAGLGQSPPILRGLRSVWSSPTRR